MEKNNKKTVGLLEKLGFMSFSTSTNIVFNFKSTYYKFFLTSILLIDPIAASNMALISTIWDIANDPLIGVWANNVKFKSGEKVRPWLLYIAVPYALGMVLLFTDFGVSERWDIILGLTVFFFYEIANTFRGIPYNGMGALASANDDDRKSINAFRSLGACLGSGIGAVAVPMIVKAFGGLKDHKVINSSDELMEKTNKRCLDCPNEGEIGKLLIRTLMDEVDVCCDSDGRKTITMIKTKK